MPRIVALVAALFAASLAEAMNWHVPQPYRAEAAVFGRSADYGDERFLHLFSYRHGVDAPGVVGEGVRGTGGSLDSDSLYYDFRFYRSFVFDNPAQAFTLDIQRSEDFDGSFDRQLVGFRQGVGDDWQLSIRGDVFADKGGSDVYFGARRLTSQGGWWDVQWVLPDAYFNDKTATNSRFLDRPHTLFVQWYRPRDGGHTVASVNVSPNSRIEDLDNDVTVRSRQNRAALEHWQTVEDIQWRLALATEYTRRNHRLAEQPLDRSFWRDYAEATFSVRWYRERGAPELGLRYLHLEEQGWFGRALDDRGELVREEPMVFAGIRMPLSDTQTLAPTVYLAKTRIHQSAAGDWSPREEDDRIIGKLSLPWHWRVSEKHGAIMTLTPSFRLHRFAFGGGNLQFHWPL